MTKGLCLILIGTGLHVIFLIPRKKTTIPVLPYYLSLTGGATILSGIIAAGMLLLGFKGFPSTFTQLGKGILLGTVWAAGSLAYISGTDRIGLSRSTAIKNLTAIIGLLMGVWIFGEFSGTGWLRLFLTISGCGMMLWASVALTRTLPNMESVGNTRGVGVSLSAALIFAVYASGVKIITSELNVFIIPLLTSLGGFLSALIFVTFRRDRVASFGYWIKISFWEHQLAFLSGILWLAGTFCITLGIKLTGVALSWSMIPFGTVISVAIGVGLFREIDYRLHRKNLAVGMVGSITAAMILFFVTL